LVVRSEERGCVSVYRGFVEAVQVGGRGFGCSQVEALSNVFDGQRCFFAEAGGDGEFVGIVFAPPGQLFCGPAQTVKFLGNDTNGAECRSFAFQLSGALNVFEQLFFEGGRAETPAAADAIERCVAFEFAAPRFHPPLELGAFRRGIFAQTMFAEQTIDSDPCRAVSGRHAVPVQTAPGIGAEGFFGRKQTGADGIEVDVIAHGFQVARGISVHEQRFVTAAENVTEELMPMVEANGIGAQQPAHAFNEVRLGGFCHEMEMVSHQATGVQLPSSFMTGLRKRLDEVLPVHIIEEYILATIAPAHEVVNRSGILNSRLAGHPGILRRKRRLVNAKLPETKD
jgi:hypothetical protein